MLKLPSNDLLRTLSRLTHAVTELKRTLIGLNLLPRQMLTELVGLMIMFLKEAFEKSIFS